MEINNINLTIDVQGTQIHKHKPPLLRCRQTIHLQSTVFQFLVDRHGGRYIVPRLHATAAAQHKHDSRSNVNGGSDVENRMPLRNGVLFGASERNSFKSHHSIHAHHAVAQSSPLTCSCVKYATTSGDKNPAMFPVPFTIELMVVA